MEFDYDSHTLFGKLKERGKALSKGKDSSLIEKDIDEFMVQNITKLNTPKTAMVTFEYPQAVNMIMKMQKQKDTSKSCCPFSQGVQHSEEKSKLAARRALLPWNIKWEWRNWSYWDSFKHFIKNKTLIIVALIFIFMVIFKVRYEIQQLYIPFADQD